MSQVSTAHRVIGVVGILTVVFIVLKLGHVITWPWVWVVSPLWVLLVTAMGVLGVSMVVYSWPGKL